MGMATASGCWTFQNAGDGLLFSSIRCTSTVHEKEMP